MHRDSVASAAADVAVDLVRIAQPFEEDPVTSSPSGCKDQTVAAVAAVAGPDKVAVALACWHLASTY